MHGRASRFRGPHQAARRQKAATFMALEDLTKEPGPSRQGPDCSVCRALDVLPPAKAKIVQAALEDKTWRYSEIAEAVATDETVPDWIRAITGGTYGKHIRGQCRARKRLRA